jgi:hypothetical protein
MSSRKKSRSAERAYLWPRLISLPAVLGRGARTRMEEVQSGTLSRYLIELTAYDLRERHLHGLTGPYAHEPVEVQQAIDLAICAHYRPGQKTTRDQLKQLLSRGFAEPEKIPIERLVLCRAKHHVYLRKLHRESILERIRELHYPHLSDYLIGLIRYDLIIGGPHKYFYGDDCTPEMCLSLDRETAATFAARKPRKCMIDYVIEEIAGRQMPVEERHAETRWASQRLRDQAVAAQQLKIAAVS